MNKLHMKVHEYDEQSHSLIVSFCTDKSEKTIDEYKKYTFNVNNYNSSDIEDAMYKIAMAGVNIANRQDLIESVSSNTNIIDNVKSHVGKSFEFDVDMLINDELVIT